MGREGALLLGLGREVAAVLLRVERGRAAGEALEPVAGVLAGAHAPAHVELHAHVLRRVGEEVLPHERAVLHRGARHELVRVVVVAERAAARVGRVRRLGVELDHLLPPAVVALGPALRRPHAAAGADEVRVAEFEVEVDRLLDHVRREHVAAHVRAARDEAVVAEHLLELLGGVAVVAGELDGLVADPLDVGERLREAHALERPVLLAGDVLADRVELHGGAAELAGGFSVRAERGAGAGRGGRACEGFKEGSTVHLHGKLLLWFDCRRLYQNRRTP